MAWVIALDFSQLGGKITKIRPLNSSSPLQKYAYSNIKKISPPKTENFRVKNSDIFHISAQNIDCGYSLVAEAVLTSTHNLCFEQK